MERRGWWAQPTLREGMPVSERLRAGGSVAVDPVVPNVLLVLDLRLVPGRSIHCLRGKVRMLLRELGALLSTLADRCCLRRVVHDWGGWRAGTSWRRDSERDGALPRCRRDAKSASLD